MMRKHTGFTLIELLIACAIIGIIIAVTLPNLLGAVNRAEDTATKAYIHHVVKGIEAARNGSTNALPPVQSCAALTYTPRDPQSVLSCQYDPDLSSDRYTVTAVSVNKRKFVYDGAEIVSVP